MFKRIEVDVLILIEHVAREMETAVLMKNKFEEIGYTVIIDSIKFHKESIIFKYKPKMVVLPWAYSNHEIDLFRNFKFMRKDDKIIMLNMHHEQISNDGSDAFIIPKDDALRVLHVSWGENFTKKLVEAGVNRENIIECGNPKLDFYKEELISFNKSRETLSKEYNIDNDKKWVVFIANSFHLLTDEQIKINMSKGVDLLEQVKVSIKNRRDFLYYVELYLQENDDTIFIYRPHPSFAHVDIEEKDIVMLCEKYKNFKCISGDSIRDWIINCDITISFHSTAVIECSVSSTPFYLFRTNKLSKDKDYKFFENYPNIIKDYDDFKKSMNQYSQFSFETFNKEIKEYIDLNSKKIASYSIVEYLDYKFKNIKSYEDDIKLNTKSFIKSCSFKYIKKMIFLISKIKLIEKYLLKKNDLRIFNLLYSGDDYFDEEYINDMQRSIKVVLNEGRVKYE